MRNSETYLHCKKLYSQIPVHLLWCLEIPDRKLESLKCPGCDKTYSDSKRVNVHLKKNICDGRRTHGRLRPDIHECVLYAASIWNKCFQMQGFEPQIIPEQFM